MYDETVRSDVRSGNTTVGGEGFLRSPVLRKLSPPKVIPAVRTSDRTVSSYTCFALNTVKVNSRGDVRAHGLASEFVSSRSEDATNLCLGKLCQQRPDPEAERLRRSQERHRGPRDDGLPVCDTTAASVISGASQITLSKRRVPTAILRRIGVDKPMLPKGAPLPFASRTIKSTARTTVNCCLLLLESLAHAELVRGSFPKFVLVRKGTPATDKTPLAFIDKGVKNNIAYYQEEILKKMVRPWSSQQFSNGGMILQKDWAPAHGAKTIMELCDRTLALQLTRPPTARPFGVERFGAEGVCKLPPDLVWEELDDDYLQVTVDSLKKRLKTCMKAKGGHFEQFLI
ncbi:hypothetical protein HPB47_000992 [Ixodes persulcatus]|uniref:Uncharacterized protein n=1 Tax=Ixodes persulcatus TaxID=34615 RepID=A0AC60PQB2_IXOPE|nr:hypothetical protein HPB47_000992 [Ixodes persulcatus]